MRRIFKKNRAISSDKEKRAQNFGMIGAAFGLGFIFGPAIGGFLSRFSYAAPAYFATAVSLLSVLATVFFLKETVDEKKAMTSPKIKLNLKEFQKILSIYSIGILIVTFFVTNLAASIQQGNFALWTQKTFNYGPAENGWLFAYIGIIAVFVQLKVLPFLIIKFKEKTILYISLFLMFIGLSLVPLSTHGNFLYVALFFLPFGYGLSSPTIQALASENVPPEKYGETLGFLQSAGSLGRIIGPIIGGIIFQSFGKDNAFYFAGFIILALLVYSRLKLK